MGYGWGRLDKEDEAYNDWHGSKRPALSISALDLHPNKEATL